MDKFFCLQMDKNRAVNMALFEQIGTSDVISSPKHVAVL